VLLPLAAKHSGAGKQNNLAYYIHVKNGTCKSVDKIANEEFGMNSTTAP
jgi:hypothetical protein